MVTAKIQPASRSARSVLVSVGESLRQLQHVPVSAHETLTELPGLGTVLVTEHPGELVLHFTGAPGTESAAVRVALSQQIRHAAGSRSAAAKLFITWTESDPDALPRASADSGA